MWGWRWSRLARSLAVGLVVVAVGGVPACSRKQAPANRPVGAKPAAMGQPAAGAKSEGVQTTSVHPGLYYECDERMVSADSPPELLFTSKWYVCGPKVRGDGLSGGRGPRDSVIRRFDLGVMWWLTPSARMCEERKVTQAEPGAAVHVTVTETSETEKIGGYTCRRYDVSLDQGPQPPRPPWRFWTTAEVDLGTDMRPLWNIVTVQLPSHAADELSAKLPGFPIRLEIPLHAALDALVTTITTFRKEEIPDSLFEVPGGYRKTGME